MKYVMTSNSALKAHEGFTLVELSIVLVILGLLVGGVLTGQSLIRAAELRSVTTQHARYVTAAHTFRDKYFAIPGDMSNAQSYWGILDATPATCKTTASTDTKTCNGNGNGMLEYAATGSNEVFRFWQHLANAGLIEGSYDGIKHGTAQDSTTIDNAPAGRISASLWYTNNPDPVSGLPTSFDGNYGNYLLIGGVSTNAPPVGMIFKPEEAYNIDMKMDDGKPATGTAVIRQTSGWTGTKCTDATASTQLGANYLLTNTAVACGLYFRNAF